MRKTAAVVVLLALLMVPGLAQDRAPAVERTFPAGGVINMDLSAGGYRISGSPSGQIRINWRTRKPSDERRVHVSIDVQGRNTAFVKTSGPRDGLHVEIEVPRKSTLNVSLSAGDLQIRSVEGTKDVAVWAGDVDIELGDTARYRRVDLSVKVGEINARAFSVDKGGLFRTFTWSGKGPYDLRARLLAGDLTLTK